MRKQLALLTAILALFLWFIGITPVKAYDIKKNYTRVSQDLEKMRGLRFKSPVPYSTKSKEYLKKFLLDTFNKELPPDKLRATEATLKIFGYVPQKFDTFQFLIGLYSEQIAGMYHPESKSMMLMEGGAGVDASSPEIRQMKQLGIDIEEIYLIHEMQHALQDQHFNLQKLINTAKASKNDDRINALQALFEGEATLIMMMHMLDQLGSVFGGTGMADMMDMSMMRDMMVDAPMGADSQQFARAPLFFKRTLLFPYLDGMVFVDRLRKRGGWQLVNRAFVRVPLSTEQIYHIDKYINQEMPIEITFKGLSKKIGNHTLLDENVIGEMGMRILFEQFTPNADFKSIAAGWGGDRYRIYASGNDHFLVWYTTWDTERDASEFLNGYLQLLQKKYPGIKWERKIPQVAYLGQAGNRHMYAGRSKTDVICIEKAPQNLTNVILTDVWNVGKSFPK